MCTYIMVHHLLVHHFMVRHSMVRHSMVRHLMVRYVGASLTALQALAFLSPDVVTESVRALGVTFQ